MILVKVPVRTISEANRSRNEHWAVCRKRVEVHRNIAKILTLESLGWRIQEKRWSVILTRIAPRALDTDNLARSMKAIRDGVADALRMNDGDERITWHYSQRKGKPKEYSVVIALEAACSPK